MTSKAGAGQSRGATCDGDGGAGCGNATRTILDVITDTATGASSSPANRSVTPSRTKKDTRLV